MRVERCASIKQGKKMKPKSTREQDKDRAKEDIGDSVFR